MGIPENYEFREAATRIFGSDECEIDDDAKVSNTDEGAWVAAWVFVRNNEANSESKTT